MLQIAVHGQDELARGVVKACRQGRSLAEVAAQLHNQHTAVDSGNLLKQLVGPVVGAVIDEHHFKGFAHLLHNLLEARIENRYVVFFVVKWHND